MNNSLKQPDLQCLPLTQVDLDVLKRGKAYVKTLCAKKIIRAQAASAELLQRAPQLIEQAVAQMHEACTTIETERETLLVLLSKFSIHKRIVLDRLEPLSESLFQLKRGENFDDISLNKVLKERIHSQKPPTASFPCTQTNRRPNSARLADFYNNQQFDRYDLSKSNLSGAGFFNCSLKAANLAQSVQAPTLWWNCKLTNANLLGIQLQAGCETVNHRVHVLAVSPCGGVVACAGHRGMVTLWNSHARKQSFQASKKQINALAFSDCGHYFWTGSDDCCVVLWDIDTLAPLFSFKHCSEILTLAVCSSYIAVGAWGPDKNLGVWKVFQHKAIAIVAAHTSSVRHLCLSPSGSCVVTKADDHSIKLWEVPSLSLLWIVARPSLLKSVAASPVAFLQSDDRFVSLEACKTVKIWNVGAQKCSVSIETAGLDMRNFAVSRCGRHLLSFSPVSSRLDLYDLAEGKRVHSYNSENDGVICVAFSFSGTLLYTGNKDNTIQTWMTPPHLRQTAASIDLSDKTCL